MTRWDAQDRLISARVTGPGVDFSAAADNGKITAHSGGKVTVPSSSSLSLKKTPGGRWFCPSAASVPGTGAFALVMPKLHVWLTPEGRIPSQETLPRPPAGNLKPLLQEVITTQP